MIDSVVFIGAAVIAVTQFLKYLIPKMNGAWTIVVAGVLGSLVGVLDIHMGIKDISVAQGIMTGLGAAGVHTLGTAISRGSSTPQV